LPYLDVWVSDYAVKLLLLVLWWGEDEMILEVYGKVFDCGLQVII
jgi:hypothetical protein